MNIKETGALRLGPRADRVYRELRRRLDSGALPYGARLPTEAELCVQFDASRNTVRKALAALGAEQRVVHRSHAGFHAALPPPADSAVVSLMYHGDLDTLTAVQNLILNKGCVMSLFSQREQGWAPELEAKFLEQVLQQRHRALLASCTPLPPRNEALLARIAAAGTRVIHIETHAAEETPRQSYLIPDYRRAGRAMATALLIAGYSRVVFADVAACVAPFHVLIRAGVRDTLLEQRDSAAPAAVTLAATETDLAPLCTPTLLAQAMARAGGSLGVVCPTLAAGQQLMGAARDAGVAIPAALGILAPELVGDVATDAPGLGRAVFGRLDLLTRAVELACAATFTGITELIGPRLIKGATVRHV